MFKIQNHVGAPNLTIVIGISKHFFQTGKIKKLAAAVILVTCTVIRFQEKKYQVSLRDMTIEEAWNSEPFEKFRYKMRGACAGCPEQSLCMGGCPLMPDIVFCDSVFRKDMFDED